MNIIIADDHTLFRDALSDYIIHAEPASNVVCVKSLDEALEALNNHKGMDVVLLDYRMPGMDGLEGLKKVREGYPACKVVLMSGLADDVVVKEALECGAVGYFPKTLSGAALLKALQRIMEGELFVPLDGKTKSILPSHYDGDMLPPATDMKMPSNLTPREKDVLHFLIQGKPNKDIADALGLQIVTVKLHVRGICKKLGAKNRTQAALIAQTMMNESAAG